MQQVGHAIVLLDTAYAGQTWISWLAYGQVQFKQKSLRAAPAPDQANDIPTQVPVLSAH